MNISIVTPHLGPSQIAFSAIKSVNKLVEEKYEDDIVLFFEQLVQPIFTPKCAVMCVNELMNFKGAIITTIKEIRLYGVKPCNLRMKKIKIIESILRIF